MSDTRLITAASIIEVTPLRGGIDHDVINPRINATQDLVLAYVIGYILMKKLQLVVDNPGANDPTGVYTDLLNIYIAPYLRWATAYKLLPDVAISIGSGGINTPDSNQGNSIFDGTMAILKQDILSSAQGYKDLLIDHLCNNTALYPEYTRYEQGKQTKTDSGQPFNGVQFY